MPRGGKRVGAGAKSTWKKGKTVTIRVPEVLADDILAFARKLDSEDVIECDTNSNTKIVDLSGVSLVSIAGQMGIKLVDLVRKGYKIRPGHLNDVVLASLREKTRKYD